MTYLNRRIATWSVALFLTALMGAVAADESESSPGPRLARFLLPPGVRARLGLNEEQQAQVNGLQREFASTNRPAIGSLPANLVKLAQAARQARQQQNREAFRELQPQLRPLMKQLSGLRSEFEPGLLTLLTEQQKKRYQELKPELERPGVVLGLMQPAVAQAGGPQPLLPPAELASLRPLTDMAETNYHGFSGGLYPGGKNTRPASHEAAGRALATKIRALDAEGKPADAGKVVLLTIGMSNTMQASGAFKEAAEGDPDLNPQLVIVNGAQGGQTAAKTQDPDDAGSGTAYWRSVDERLTNSGVSRAQVQAVWVKQADAAPTEGFPHYAQKLESELARIMQVLQQRFPNLKLVYLSSRTYGGFAKTRLNPEPYAFESGFSVKWLIERQLKGAPSLNYDPAKGPVTAPWLSWGPYLWANGTTPRADGFAYEPSDFALGDGTHESPQGQRKVGQQLLRFFKTDSTTRGWFLKP